MVYGAVCSRCGEVEISKPMAADFPSRHACGGALKRRYSAPAITFNAPGFYATDVSHFQKQLGPARYARFEAERAAAQKRAAQGRLTPYERQLEHV